MGELYALISYAACFLPKRSPGVSGVNPLFGSQFYLLDDRLCYTNNPSSNESVKYLPLDRIPVRPLPRHYGPRIGVSRISTLQNPRRPVGSVFGVHCGRRTHFMAAESAALAKVSLQWSIIALNIYLSLGMDVINLKGCPASSTGLGKQDIRDLGACC